MKTILTNFESSLQEDPLRLLMAISKVIALAVGIGLVMTSAVIVYNAFVALFENKLDLALQDGLFVLILLEMIYVVRSFVKYGSINVSLVVNVGIIAAVKELVLKMHNLTMQLAIAFGVIFVTLGLTYLMEQYYYSKIVKSRLKEA